MMRNRAPKPLLLLLLVLAAVLSPAMPKSAAQAPLAGITRAATPASSTAAPGSTRRTGVEHRSTDTTELRNEPTSTPLAPHVTAAADTRLAAPALLLVQRPRPPTTRLAGTGIDAPSGRSPPAPAGT